MARLCMVDDCVAPALWTRDKCAACRVAELRAEQDARRARRAARLARKVADPLARERREARRLAAEQLAAERNVRREDREFRRGAIAGAYRRFGVVAAAAQFGITPARVYQVLALVGMAADRRERIRVAA